MTASLIVGVILMFGWVAAFAIMLRRSQRTKQTTMAAGNDPATHTVEEPGAR